MITKHCLTFCRKQSIFATITYIIYDNTNLVQIMIPEEMQEKAMDLFKQRFH